MPQGEHGKRPPQHDRGGQNLPKRQPSSIGDLGQQAGAQVLTGIALDSGPDSIQERYYPKISSLVIKS